MLAERCVLGRRRDLRVGEEIFDYLDFRRTHLMSDETVSHEVRNGDENHA